MVFDYSEAHNLLTLAGFPILNNTVVNVSLHLSGALCVSLFLPMG